MRYSSPQSPDLRASLCPEAQLLLCCHGPTADAVGTERINVLIDEGIDSNYLLELASRHGMVQLLYCNLHTVRPDAVSRHLRHQYRINTVHSRFLAREVQKLHALLQSHGIAAIPYKGPALSAYIYGSASLRQSSDLDILVQPDDVRAVRDVLLRAGYQRGTQHSPEQEEFCLQRYCEYTFMSPHRIAIEVHWGFVEPYLALPPDYSRLWQRLFQIDVCGHQVNSLHPEDLFLALCIHGTKHMWEQFNWICDIAALLRRSTPLNWFDLLLQARKIGSTRMLLLGLMVADTLIGLDLPPAIRQKMGADRAVGILANQTCSRLFQHPRPGTNIVAYHVRAKERLRDHLRYYYRFHAWRVRGLAVGIAQPFFVWEDWAAMPASFWLLCRSHPPFRYLLGSRQ